MRRIGESCLIRHLTVQMSWSSNIVNAMCFIVDLAMWLLILFKLRFCKNNGDETTRFELELSTELTIHAYYICAITVHFGQTCWDFPLPIAQSIHLDSNETLLCRMVITTTMTIVMLYQLALHNILLNRLYYAFKGTNGMITRNISISLYLIAN